MRDDKAQVDLGLHILSDLHDIEDVMKLGKGKEGRGGEGREVTSAYCIAQSNSHSSRFARNPLGPSLYSSHHRHQDGNLRVLRYS